MIVVGDAIEPMLAELRRRKHVDGDALVTALSSMLACQVNAVVATAMYLDGGADTFNMVVPHSREFCNNGTITS